MEGIQQKAWVVCDKKNNLNKRLLTIPRMENNCQVGFFFYYHHSSRINEKK